MKLSELRRAFAGNEAAYAEFTVLLVDLDTVPSDGVDVIVSPVREVELDAAAGEIRLYSAAQRPGTDQPPLALFEEFSGLLPLPGVYDVDFTLRVQLPIAPEDPQGQAPELQPLAGVWIGREEEEIWLLVRDVSGYPEDLLPR
jgi:hypothetical protein